MSAEQLKQLSDEVIALKAENRRLADALTRAPAQQGGEVVAWLIVDSDGVKVMLLGANEYARSADDIAAWANANRYTIRPLVCGEAAPVQPVGAVGDAEVLRLIQTVKYMVGIAERGMGRSITDDDGPVEQFVLRYVQQLEKAAAPTPPAAEPVGHVYVNRSQESGAAILDVNLYERLEAGTKLYTQPPASPADAVDAGRWIACTDKMPPVGQTVLAVRHGRIGQGCWMDVENGNVHWFFNGSSGAHAVQDFSHWMPLPALPDAAIGEGMG